jgi:small subunit ribosomal protein S3e
MIHSGNPARDFITTAVRHVDLRQGVLGIKVKIMLDNDPTGRNGPKQTLPDIVTILEPKEENAIIEPSAQDFRPAAAAPVAAEPVEA